MAANTLLIDHDPWYFGCTSRTGRVSEGVRRV